MKRRLDDFAQANLLDLTHVLVVEVGDSEKQIVDAVAFSPLCNPLHGTRYGNDAFEPAFNWLSRHDGWFEIIQTVGNDGLAFIIFVEDREGVIPELRCMCQAFIEGETCVGF